MIDYLEEVLDQEEEQEEPEELEGRFGPVLPPRKAGTAPEENGEADAVRMDSPPVGDAVRSEPDPLLPAQVRAAERSAAGQETVSGAAEGRAHMPAPRAETAGAREVRAERARASEPEARMRTAERRASEPEVEAGAEESDPGEAVESRDGIRAYRWESSARLPGGGRALPGGPGAQSPGEGAPERPGTAGGREAAAGILRRSGGRGAEALYAGLARLRAAAAFAGVRERVAVSLPEQTGPAAVRAGLETADLDRRFQRDARRYDGGFTLY